MRLSELEISGFRGFARRERFDLDASAVIVVGANGQGKTSFFDAVLWAITGKVPRLGEDDDAFVSIYSESGEARVSLLLVAEDGTRFSITRRFDGEDQHVLVKENETTAQGSRAANLILEKLWTSFDSNDSSNRSLTDVLTRSVYLQQDLVRQFIESDDEQQRFSVASELCGAGHVMDLQQKLEKSRNLWSRRTTSLQSEAEDLEVRVAAARDTLERLDQQVGVADEALPELWDAWWNDFLAIADRPLSPPDASALDAATTLDQAVREVRNQRQRRDQQIDRAETLRNEILERDSGSKESPDVVALQEQARNLHRQAEEARKQLEDARTNAAENRRRQVELAERNRDLVALAEIALRHLDESECPVCGQEIDRGHVASHLQDRVSSGTDEQVRESFAEEIAQLVEKNEELDRSIAFTQAELQQAEAVQREAALWAADRDRRLVELGIDSTTSDATNTALSLLLDDVENFRRGLLDLERRAEEISLHVARLSEARRRGEAERTLTELQKQSADHKQRISERQETGELASKIINELRGVSLDVVAARMEEIGPLLQRIYSTADPHPTFRSVRVLSRVFRGRGRLSTEIADPLNEKTSGAPEVVLSSSQMNALAVSIFLALNLGTQGSPLSAIMLDDPLQSLDDVNLLGLIDLFRRLTANRQLIVSTHDSRFGKLLQRKLRPVTEAQRTRVIELEGWERQGPTVRSFDVERDTRGLRIVAA